MPRNNLLLCMHLSRRCTRSTRVRVQQQKLPLQSSGCYAIKWQVLTVLSRCVYHSWTVANRRQLQCHRIYVWALSKPALTLAAKRSVLKCKRYSAVKKRVAHGQTDCALNLLRSVLLRVLGEIAQRIDCHYPS